jgi:hypothetical protein
MWRRRRFRQRAFGAATAQFFLKRCHTMAEFPFTLPFAEQGLHGVQIALLDTAHAGLWRQPTRDPG